MVRDLSWQVPGMPCFDPVDRSRWWRLGDRWVKEDSPCQWVTVLEASQGQNRSLQRAIQEGPEMTHPAAIALLGSLAPEPPVPQALSVKQVQESLPQFTWTQSSVDCVDAPHPIKGLGSIYLSLVEGLYEYSVNGGHTSQVTTCLVDAVQGITRDLTAQRDLLNQALNTEQALQVKESIEDIAELLGTKGFQAFNFKHFPQMSDCALAKGEFSVILEVRPWAVALRHRGTSTRYPVNMHHTEAAVAAILTIWDKASRGSWQY